MGRNLGYGGKSSLKGAYVITGIAPRGANIPMSDEEKVPAAKEAEGFMEALRLAERMASEALAAQGFPLLEDQERDGGEGAPSS